MAIAFARISYHSRSQGHSAVAGAAYRAGVALYDDRTGEQHDFKNRSDVIYSQVLLPEGASEYLQDRETLWNAVEAAEMRKNSQVAKDIILALPRDLDLSHQIDLAKHFANYHFVRHGIVADVAIHDHGDGNPHAHIYIATRRLHGDRFDKYKARDLEPDVVRGRVVNPQYWGEQWREFQNQYFKDHDIVLLVDPNHIVSMRHEGHIRGNGSHYLKEENQLRRDASIEIAVNDPDSVLNLLGTKHAVFSERDIALLINKNTETKEEYDTAHLRLKAHRDLVLLGPGDDGRDRYTTRANYEREASMAEHAHALNRRNKHAVSGTLLKQSVREFGLNSEQRQALSHIADSGDICAVVGRAGTGKSYMMRAARQMWEASGYRVRGMAVSGIASKGLEADSGIPSTTIHSLKMQIAFGSLELGPNDVLVMDEAGMTDLHDLAVMVDVAKASGAKLVLIGDHSQLQPVGPGAPFRAIVEQIGFSELNQIQRQDDPGDCAASILLSRGSIDQAIDHYAAKQQIHLLASDQEDDEDDGGSETGGSAAVSRLVAHWGKGLTSDNIQERLILAHRNIDVAELNKTARQAMRDHGLLGRDSQSVNTIDGPIELSSGDRVIFLRNNRQLGLSNGEFATVLKVDSEHITVRLGKKQMREMIFSSADYHDFNYGYAATVHKSQGATFDHTFVYVAGRAWDRFLVYVAMTRHRKTLNVYADQSQFKDMAALTSTLSRAVFKDSVLDWPVSFAIRRGFDPESIIGRFIDKVAGIKQAVRDKWLFVVNYAAFKTTKAHRQTLQSKAGQRELARKVALFVDLRNGLGAQARLMRQDLKPNEKFSSHHDYQTWQEQTLLKNQLAFEIKQQYPLFEKALELNRISHDTLDKIALDHERALRVKAYLEHYKKEQRVHCYRLAEKIHPDLSKHFSYIVYQAKNEELPSKTIIRQIGLDAMAYQRLNQLKGLSVDEKRDFRVADRYVQVDSDIKTAISRAYALGGFDKLSDVEVKMLSHQKATSDKLAHELVKYPERYTQGLHFYDLDEDKLIDGYERHLSRSRVKQLDNASLSSSVRDALCAELLSDRRYYPLIAEQSLDWKQLRERRDVHQHREKLRTLPAEQRRYYRLVDDYQRARLDAGIAWSQLFKDKEKKQLIPAARWQFAISLSHVRDRLAHDIVTNSEHCMPFITPTLLKLADIEKHATRYNEHLSTLRNNPPAKHRYQRSISKTSSRQRAKPHADSRLDYQAINDALVNLGEDFYSRVLGKDYKRSGNHLRFGRKGSFNVTISSTHAGCWHSFETDEGGGPIQLLMNPTYGWGLSFPEALKEGARLAGLSLEPSMLSVKPPKNVSIPSAQQDDKSEKIARARYYYHSAEPLHGTLGERYLREHRHIDGELSAFRFHPSIRDDVTDKEGNHHVSYHPGIVVAARNSQGDITAVQTILLDPETANKVSEQSVGAVKRTRGDLKGSAVLIHDGKSNKIIIAEGPETAASLIQAEPNANIYVTLGNIKNASALGWLAEKHQTNTFYFAADNDGANAKNIRALQDVALSLTDEHHIQSHISIPTLPHHEKCDFNDVLQEKGLDEVKQQLSQTRAINIIQREKREAIPADEIHGRLHASVDEWERLKGIKSHAVDRVLLAKSRLDKATKPLGIDIQTHGYENAIKTLCRQEKLFSKVKAIAPGLAKSFEKIIQPPKAVKIDWLSDEFNVEFDNLKQSKDSKIQYLVKFRDLLKNAKDDNQTKRFTRRLESLAMDIVKSTSKQNELKQLAPKLISKMSEFARFKSKQRNIGRDL